ncbi:hypothetical protein N7478_006217 [Penicillium angulare]|uniref:uncharacterized protein n=1 Tax=Penicillium angulare TaxID=116970 RepID=UPI00253FA84B|nr:uncharacterized protein N7478_006217 [Penicillium angulare]KAJ5280845.1 hypothetical protein N7478_006217 [Penicillium angulare]
MLRAQDHMRPRHDLVVASVGALQKDSPASVPDALPRPSNDRHFCIRYGKVDPINVQFTSVVNY